MNKVPPPPPRRSRAFRAPALAGTAAMLVAVFGTLVIAQTPSHGVAAGNNPGASMPGFAGAPTVALDTRGVAAAKAGAAAAATAATIVPASMNNWAAPLTPDELHQTRRKLTPEERNLLRQEIKTAGEEVYEPYRNKKR